MSRAGAMSVRQALFNVFVAPTITRPTAAFHVSRAVQQTERTFSTTQCLGQIRKKTKVEPEVRKEKWDSDITAPYVRLVDVATNTLSDMRRTKDVLRNLDTRDYRLVQVAEGDRNDPESVPLCKIINKKEDQKQKQATRLAKKDSRKARAMELSVKTVELNWAIDSNDLQHRMDRVKEFLTEGRKVEIVLANKKRGRKATPAECERVVKTLYATLNEVPGAKEQKPKDGDVGIVAMYYFQGRAPAVPAPAKDKPLDMGVQESSSIPLT